MKAFLHRIFTFDWSISWKLVIRENIVLVSNVSQAFRCQYCKGSSINGVTALWVGSIKDYVTSLSTEKHEIVGDKIYQILRDVIYGQHLTPCKMSAQKE